MRILLLADLHIGRNAPWSAPDSEWEDWEYTLAQIDSLMSSGDILPWTGCILAGDTFSSSRILQGDVRVFNRLMGATCLENVTGVCVNGNHDPGPCHIAEDLGFRFLSGRTTEFFGRWSVSGRSFSADLDAVKTWLSGRNEHLVVIHQSSAPFIDLGGLDVGQLSVSDYPKGSITVVGDTHITGCVPLEGGGAVISPGILCPMKDIRELIDSRPQLVTLELPDDSTDLSLAEIGTIPLKKRRVYVSDPEKTADSIAEKSILEPREKQEPPPVLYLSKDDVESLSSDMKKRCRDAGVRVFTVPDQSKIEQLLPGCDAACDSLSDVSTIVEAADSLYDSEDKTRKEALGILKTLLETNEPERVLIDYINPPVIQ